MIAQPGLAAHQVWSKTSCQCVGAGFGSEFMLLHSSVRTFVFVFFSDGTTSDPGSATTCACTLEVQEVAVAQVSQVYAGIGIHASLITTYARSNTFSHAVADVKGSTVATLHGLGSGHTYFEPLGTLGPVIFSTVRIGWTIVVFIYGCLTIL
jgi:hypothetical protein